jgi:hypothetical protein
MRLIAFVLAAFIVSGPAAAQSWQEYTYPDYAFTVMFPAAPKIETTTHEVVEGRSVPARVYSVRQDKSEFKITVADLADTGLDEKTVIDHAIKTLAAGGEVKVNFPHRIYQVYGRQLSIAGADGSHATVAMFDINGRLYQIEAKVLAGGNDFDLIRFQQSLVFERGVSNRSPETIRAIREACAGKPNQPNNPAGLDDPRCTAQ